MNEKVYIELSRTEWEKLRYECTCYVVQNEVVKECDYCQNEKAKNFRLNIYNQHHYTCGPDGKMREGTILKAYVEKNLHRELLKRLFLGDSPPLL